MFYKNKKTKEVVQMLATALDRSGQFIRLVIVYCPNDNEHTIYTMAESEFFNEFELFEEDSVYIRAIKHCREWSKTDECNQYTEFSIGYEKALDDIEAYINDEKATSN